MDIKNIGESLHPLEIKVIPFIAKYSTLFDIASASNLKEVEVMRALQWLSNKKLLELKEESSEMIFLDTNGIKYLKEGLPERKFLELINKKAHSIEELKKLLGVDEVNICIGQLRQKAAIEFGTDKKIQITNAGKNLLLKESLEEKFLKKNFPIKLKELSPEEKFAFQNLIKRKNIIKTDIKKIKSAQLTDLGKKISTLDLKGTFSDTLTPNMLKTGEWKNSKFRKYDISANVPNITGGKPHFMNQAIDYIKRIWLDLGFKEMTGPMVQTSFWDLDALFVPQDHPARQMQDTFFIKNHKGVLPPIWKKIKDTHEIGSDTGSKGWGGKWSEEIAKQTMLITHDTYLSAQVLSNIKKEDLPVKSFQIMKVFRNEALDWKHLFEFYQVGGIVVDKNVNFSHLLGYLKIFFTKMGFDDVRIRPAHFPYTEPSAEIEVLHPKHKEWIELGGSGIFRPEVVKPLLGFECPVLAWGFGMGRIVSEYWEINDIRELYNNDLKKLKEMKYWMR